MFLKLLVTAAVLGTLWLVLFRGFRRSGASRTGRGRRLPQARPLPLVKCQDCGIYLPAGQPCNCRDGGNGRA